MKEIKYLPRMLSDHSPLLVDFALGAWYVRSCYWGKAIQSRLVDAERELHEAETRYSTPNHDTYSNWQHKARELDLVLLERTQKKLLFLNQRIFELGDKNSRLLAYLS